VTKWPWRQSTLTSPHRSRRHPRQVRRQQVADIPRTAPGFLARHDQVAAASKALGVAGLPVDELLSAARWLESFSRGESDYGGTGPLGRDWLAAMANAILQQAGNLAAELAERQA
jgi:hypothetical protein